MTDATAGPYYYHRLDDTRFALCGPGMTNEATIGEAFAISRVAELNRAYAAGRASIAGGAVAERELWEAAVAEVRAYYAETSASGTAFVTRLICDAIVETVKRRREE